MKNSIKRAQSQACLGFAERKNFRPLAKLKKLSLTLVALLALSTGAWATTYTELKVDDVVKVGDKLAPTQNWNIMMSGSGGGSLGEGRTYTLKRSNIENGGFVESNDGVCHAFVNDDDGSDYFYWTTTATSDGIVVKEYTYEIWVLGIHEPSADGPEVTISQDAETKQYEASFQMPQYDVTATYTIKRDMSVKIAGEMANRIRIQMVDNEFQAVDASQMNPVVKDNLETVTLTETTDYMLQLQKKTGAGENDWTDVTALSVGTFRYKITGAGNYSGICYSEVFELFQGYEVTVPAGEYVTFYKDEALTLNEGTTDAELYTITEVNETATEATLSDAITVAPANTPLLVKNRNASETKKILLIPTTETAATVTFYEGFKGTLEAKTTANTDTYGPWNMDEGTKYYGFNGTDFVWIREAGNVAAHRCWIELSTTAASAAPQIRLIFSSTTGIESVDREQSTVDGWYDLNGRRLPGKPTKKGVYIVNGKKMVVK